MYRTYTGYFQNGQFVSPELVTIPDNIKVHVTIIGDELPLVDNKTTSQKQNEALKRLSAGLKAIDAFSEETENCDEPTLDEVFDYINSNRFNIDRELNL